MPAALDALLRPRSVAIVGASNRARSLGGMVTRRLFAAGFTGKLFPVNPKQDAIHSTKCYPSLEAIPDPVDLALIVVPRDAVLPAVEECVRKGVRGVALISSGFKEADEEGARLEERITETLREAGIRFIGPNCMGLFNTSDQTALDATFSPTPPLAGPIGFASQSGALGVVVLNIAGGRGLGFSHFLSLGNKSDVDENDALEAWAEDPEVPVITLYLESFADAERTLELARQVARTKPVVLLKAGRSAAGAKAASSHTGALAAADTGSDALCRQAGIVRVATVDEMLDAADVLARCPLPSGPRVAVLTNAGGPGIMAVDELVAQGLEIAPLGEATREALAAQLPSQASVGNPVDVLPSASPADYAFCLGRLLGDEQVDAVVTITVTPPLFDPREVLRAMAPVARESGKPVLTVFMVAGPVHDALPKGEAPPVFHAPEPAARALAAARSVAARRARGASPTASPTMDWPKIRALVGEKAATGGGYLGAAETFALFEAAQLPVCPWAVAHDGGSIARAAGRVGYPVVLKAVGDDMVHKSDLGGVILGIENESALLAAYDRMQARLGAAGLSAEREYLVQGMRAGGREVIVGAHRDEHFGPLVMFGLGGKFVEVFKDVRFAMASLTRADAEEMVHTIRGLPILAGTRGEAGVDLEPAIDAIERIAALTRGCPEILELDINPLLLFPKRAEAVLVDARLRVADRSQR